MKSSIGNYILKFFHAIGISEPKAEKFIYLINKFIFFSQSPHIRSNRRIIREFSKLFYNQSLSGGSWNSTRWLGVKTLKNPLDLFVYQEIIVETKPDIIIETGTAFGGSALFLASILDSLSKGRVLTVEINRRKMPEHKRIKYFFGSSTSEEIVLEIKNEIRKGDQVLVILDSDHKKEHVLAEMDIYSKMVSKGSYLIVEDTNINGHPVWQDHGEGPYEAVRDFLKINESFVVDRSREKYLLTNNPGGFLKRVRA